MTIKVAGGAEESGIVVGNTFDKYSSRNPIVKWMMGGFDSALSDLVEKASPETINEVGCGEGYWVLRWLEQGLLARGCDFSKIVIDIARKNALDAGISDSIFEPVSIYDLSEDRDSADLIVCCEVLEHLENPDIGMQALQRVVRKNLIISVPQEPIWCALNLARGKYISRFGNTPGHIQHWSRKSFIKFVSKYFIVDEVKSPFPWTMILCRPFL
ncbi:tRNA 5-carboxymethoxyuridine methyltransferase [Microbulbifer aestuariivivens]|uniref:tRNA 5-carboxymethoxyuridine methyltransferase n=1 Tax=Microbulbifer aestuariivivens TaxID=1908308 RepID=A0ABP9WR39_9GAMM